MDSSDFVPQWQLFNRTYIGVIDSVDETKQTCSVIVHGLGVKRDNLELPTNGILVHGFKSAWDRFCPEKGDHVYVAFGPQDEMFVLGHATLSGDLEKLRSFQSSIFPLADYRVLKAGEWDKRSSGGAYMFGDNRGNLLLSSGPTTQIRLRKGDNEIRGETGLHELRTFGSYARIGDVKRTLLPTDFKETDVSILDPTATKEWNVHLINGLTSTVIADEQFGAVRDGLGVPRLGSVGLPLRYRRKIWTAGTSTLDPVPLAVFSSEIDALGNTTVSTGLATTSVSLSAGPLTAVSSSALSHSISSTTTTAISGTAEASLTSSVHALVDAAVVSLGQLAISPAVKGAEHAILFTTFAGACAGAFSTIAGLEGGPTSVKGAAYTTIATAFTTLAAGLAATLSHKVLVE